jgi:hypothetical protein
VDDVPSPTSHTGEQKQKKRTFDVLPKPDNLIRYQQRFVVRAVAFRPPQSKSNSRRRLKGLANDLGDIVVADLARRAGKRLVVEARHSMLGEPPPPFSYGVGRSAHPQADVLVLRAFCRVQNDPRPLRQPCAVLRRDARLSSSRRSLCVKSIATAVLPIAKILRANAPRESHIFVDRDTGAFCS